MAEILDPLTDDLTKPRRRFRRGVMIVVVILGGLFLFFVGWYLWLAMRELSPNYHAKRALPIIGALNTFHLAKGRYPVRPSDLASYLPIGITAIDNLGGFGFNGSEGGVEWKYSPDATSKTYELDCQIRDQDLSYNFDGTDGKWWWTPGDGSDNIKELKIAP